MIRDWDPTGYPASYLETFTHSNEEEVEKVANYLGKSLDDVDCILFQTPGGSEKSPAIVYTVYDKGKGSSWTGVNFSEPGKTPGEYDEYARTFYTLDGPTDVQIERATLLAGKLGKRIVYRFLGDKPVDG